MTDTRGRASLGHPNREYRLTEQSDGTLILEPAVVMSELEARFLANTELQAQIAYYDEHPEELVFSARRRARRAAQPTARPAQ
jgi:hypothetical protein